MTRHGVNCVKTWRQPQNRKYITYHNAIGERLTEPRPQVTCTGIGEVRSCDCWDTPAHRQTDRQTAYSSQYFTRVADMPSRRRLRSSSSDRLHVPIIRRSTIGSHSFTVSGAAVWNDLPAHVTAAPSLAVFRQCLKTFLFSRWFPGILIWLANYTYSFALVWT